MRSVASQPPGSKPPLPPPLEGFGKRNTAAVSEFGKQFEGLDLAVDGDDDPIEIARRSAGKSDRPKPEPKPESAKPAHDKPDRPNLEPIGDDTHKHRRIPTQPPSALQLQLDDDPTPVKPTRLPPTEPSRPSQPPGDASEPLPPPPKLAPRHSPAPARRGLVSSDRITNLLACAALGLIVMIYPARQIARGYETREVEPLLAELQGSIDHPLGVQAGLIEKPEAIAARIEDGRRNTRNRYLAIWMLVGLPIGLGAGFIRRD